MNRPDVLVLGGGGVLGEAWLRSVLAGLETGTGWDLRQCDVFVGTSAGSIVAAVLAAGRRPEVAEPVARAWEDAAAAAPADAPGALRRFAGGTVAALSAPVAPLAAASLQPGRAALRAAILRRGPAPTRRIPQLAAALRELGGSFDGRLLVTAVERGSGRRVVFGAPDAPVATVADAVVASCSVPWVFRPITIGGVEYVDGGAWSPANLDVAPVRRGTRVLCLNPTASPRLARDRLGAVRTFAAATSAGEALVLRGRGAKVTIVAPDAGSVAAIGPDLFDALRRPAVEAAGFAQGRALAAAA